MYRTNARGDRHITTFVIAWLLIVPLFYFAAESVLWFQTDRVTNNPVAERYGVLVTSGFSQHDLTSSLVPVFLALGCMMLLRIREIVHLCLRERIFIASALLAILSGVWSQAPRASVEFGICLLVDTAFAFYLCVRLRPSQRLELLMLVGWIVIVLSIVLGAVFPEYGVDRRDALGAWQGVFIHKNRCALTICFLIPAGFYVPARTSLSKLLRFSYISAGLFLLVMTQSRTGWIVALGLGLYISMSALISRFPTGDTGVVATVALMVSVIIMVFVLSNWNYIALFLGKDPTLTGRTNIWTLVWNSISQRPMLGYGYKAFWMGLHGESANISLRDSWIVPGAHNGILDLWLQLGALGVSLFIASLWRVVRRAKRLVGTRSPYLQWCACIVVVTLLTNIDETTIMQPNYLTWILYVVACTGITIEEYAQ